MIPLATAAPAYAQGADSAAEPGAAEALAGALASVAGAAVLAVVWCVSNAINVLLLVAPGFAVPVLKGFRASVAGGLAALEAVHPLLGLIAAAAVALFCALVVRWSFRLTVWGTLFSFDLLTRRWRRPDPRLAGRDGHPRARAFAAGRARQILRVPKRALGTLELGPGGLRFSWRRFLTLPARGADPRSRHYPEARHNPGLGRAGPAG